MKKVLVATGVAVLALATVVSAQGYMFDANLTVGSTGPGVVALQTALMNAGFNIPSIASGAAAKGYFGSQTQAAVKSYQASRGVPNTGFVGPLTRAALNGGTSGGSTVVACPIGFVCTPVGGTTGGTVVSGSTGSITTPGAEGIITTKVAAQPVSDANVRDFLNVPAYGIEVKAQGSDMMVDRVLLQIGVTVSSSATNPATFITRLHAYDGSTLLKSWTLSAADFNRDSSDRYYIIASGLRFVVPRDATKVLTFRVDTVGVSSDQANRVATFQGYVGNSQNVRAVDGAGLNSYTDMSGTSNSRTQTFNSSGTSALTVTLNSSLTPKSTNNKVDSTDGVKGLTTQVIELKSTTGVSIVKTIYVHNNATSSAGLPSTIYLYDGSTLLGSVSSVGNQNSVAFTDLNLAIAKDQTKLLTIKTDHPTTASGQAASTSIPTNGVKFEKPDGTTASSSNSVLAGNSQYLFSAAPQWTLVSTSVNSSAGVVGVASSSVTGTIVLKAKAVGGAMTKPVVGDFTVVFASSTQTTYSAANSVTGGNKSVTVSPSDATISEGNEYTVTVTDTVYSNDSEIGSSQPLFMAISEIDAVVGSVTITNQTWGIDTFYTAAAQLTKGTF